MILRKAKLRDIPEIESILSDAVKRMLQEGKHQWTEDYPTQVHILEDIRNDVGYVLEKEGRVVGYGAVVFTGEPAYDNLDGMWMSDERYVVVHRIAVAQDLQSQGIGRHFMLCVEHLAVSKGIRSFRIDTNFDNDRMLRLLERCGFEYCGMVRYDTGERRAFEKLI